MAKTGMGLVPDLKQFAFGPVWGGDLIGKTGRDKLEKLGYVTRVKGWTTLTARGLRVLVDLEIVRS